MIGASLDKFIEMVCMNLTQLPDGMVIQTPVIDAAIQEANARIRAGEVISSWSESLSIARLHPLSFYRAGPFVYCRAQILEESAPPLSYGLTCGIHIEGTPNAVTNLSFCTVSAIIHPSKPLTK